MPDTAAIAQQCRVLGGTYVEPDEAAVLVVEWAAQRAGKSSRSKASLIQAATRDVVSMYLVRAAQAGQEPASHRLVNLWHVEVLQWCRWQAGRGINADDAAHDVLLRVLTDVHRIREPNRFRPWLWRVTWHVLKEHGRKPWVKRWVFADTPLLSAPDTGPLADEALERQSDVDQVKQVLADMSTEGRGLLWMHYVEGMSRSEICDQLDMPQGTLNRKMTKARKEFQRLATRVGLNGALTAAATLLLSLMVM